MPDDSRNAATVNEGAIAAVTEREVRAVFYIPLPYRIPEHTAAMLEYIRAMANICERNLEVISEVWITEPEFDLRKRFGRYITADYAKQWWGYTKALTKGQAACEIFATVKIGDRGPKDLRVLGSFERWHLPPLPRIPDPPITLISFSAEMPRCIWDAIDREKFIKLFLQGCGTFHAVYGCIDDSEQSPFWFRLSPFMEFSSVEPKNFRQGIPNICWGQYITPERLADSAPFEEIMKHSPCKFIRFCEVGNWKGVWLQLSDGLDGATPRRKLSFRKYFNPFIQRPSIEKMAAADDMLRKSIDKLPLLPEERALLKQKRREH